MKTIATVVTVALLALAACGDDGDDNTVAPESATTPREVPMEKNEGAAMKAKKPGTAITASDSEFGEILFDSTKQAICIFENDSKAESDCYDDCAEAWPPVLTKGEPKAADGIDAELLGTTQRDDGTTQVTYADQPLYYYANEGPGEVECHNVNLNGGFWWVVGPDGKRRP